MLRSTYNEIIKEHFDITDTLTRKCLISINEADQNQVLGSLASRLYDSIVKRVTDIDFGQIPMSKGDFTKIPNHLEIVECLTTVRDIIVQQRQSTATIDTIFNAIDNLKNTKNIWERGYAIDCEMAVVFYNTIALSIVSATSLYISATVEFVKNPESDVVDIELAKVSRFKSKDGLLFKNLDKFNKACKKGDIEKTFTDILKAQKHIKENTIRNKNGEVYITEFLTELFGAIITGTAILGLLSCVIPILHQLTAALYNLRQNVADYLAGEADIIKLNAEKINYDRAKTPEQRKKIVARQMKIADRFKKWSNKLMIKATAAEKQAQKQIVADNEKKSKITDVVEEVPDSSIF